MTILNTDWSVTCCELSQSVVFVTLLNTDWSVTCYGCPNLWLLWLIPYSIPHFNHHKWAVSSLVYHSSLNCSVLFAVGLFCSVSFMHFTKYKWRSYMSHQYDSNMHVMPFTLFTVVSPLITVQQKHSLDFCVFLFFFRLAMLCIFVIVHEKYNTCM